MKTQDDTCLYQFIFTISQLLHEKVKLKEKIWLKQGEIFLWKNNKDIAVYILSDSRDHRSVKRKIMPYLWVSSLISYKTALIGGGSSLTIKSRDELGTGSGMSAKVHIDSLPDEALSDVEKHAPEFIFEIVQLHEKYIKVIEDNKFISRSLYYYYDSRKKGINTDDGFISAMISLESLFNEGPSDIKHKLSLRGAFLLGLADFDAVKVYQKLKEFYVHRSNLIHGKKDLPYDLDWDLFCNYTRSAVIIFIILLSEVELETVGNKEELLKEIDNAMLNPKIKRLIKKKIQEKISDFSLKVPRTFEGNGERGFYRTTVW